MKLKLYFRYMQYNLQDIPSEELVERLRLNSQYYMLLCKTEADATQRKVAQEYIDAIISEMKTRDGYKDVLEADLSLIPHQKVVSS